MTDKIFWLGHSSILIRSEKTIYIDPWKVRTKDQADLILISHSHGDHLSPEDVKRIRKDDTVIVTTADAAPRLSGDVRILKPGENLTAHDIPVEAVPAYNTHTHTHKAFHSRRNGWIGFVVTVEGKRIYYAGDTDVIPEMETVRADVVIFPIGGTYTMTAAEAAKAVNIIEPESAIPIHWGDIVGSAADARTFQELCKVPVTIKKPL
ncbi:MAG: MBL fold metallo-hydrolase [Syntrophaceae bacterium]|nr:MBL fold metallo-hydrolase [Syntrophaceae bacterium]